MKITFEMNFLKLFFLTCLLIGSVGATTFSTIDSVGLSFASSSTIDEIKPVLCPFLPPLLEPVCIPQFLNNKIVDKISDSTIQQISSINSKAAESIKTFNNVKDVLNNGNEIELLLLLNETGVITQGNLSFGNTGNYVGKLLGLKNNKDAYAKNLKINFNTAEKHNFVGFQNGNYFELLQREQKTVFQGIKNHDKNSNSYFKLNLTGSIIGADFTTISSKGFNYIIWNNKMYVPANSRLLFDGKKIKIVCEENSILETPPKLINQEDESFLVEIQGKNLKIGPLDDIKDLKLEKGIITYEKSVPYIKLGNTATINGIKIIPKSNDVEIRFSEKSVVRSVIEFFKKSNKKAGNYVMFVSSKEIEMNGLGFRIEFDPEIFSEESNPSDNFAKEIIFANAVNQNYFTFGDKGENVKLIQRLVGIKEDGVYDEKTARAVKIWQKENGISTDGLFGKNSLEAALNYDVTQKMTIEANGGSIIISQENGEITIDYAKDAEFSFAGQKYKSKSLIVNDYMQKVSLSNTANGRYFTLGDKGENVKLIQRLVGIKEDGVYDEKTARAVKIWQKENGISIDGLFGSESLATSLEGKEVFYKSIKESYANNFGAPSNIKLRDNNGKVVSVLKQNKNGQMSYEKIDGGTIRSELVKGKKAYSLNGLKESTGTALKLAVGRDESFNDLQKNIDTITDKVNKGKPLSEKEIDTLRGLYGSLVWGGKVKAPEASTLLDHYLSGEGGTIEINPKVYQSSSANRDVQALLKKKIEQDISKNPLKKGEVRDIDSRILSSQKLLGGGQILPTGYILTEQNNVRAKNTNNRYLLSVKYQADNSRKLKYNWYVKDEYSFEEKYFSEFSIRGHKLRIPDSLSAALVDILGAKPFEHISQWNE